MMLSRESRKGTAWVSSQQCLPLRPRSSNASTIARSIARVLRLNEDLTEAIALARNNTMGNTPVKAA